MTSFKNIEFDFSGKRFLVVGASSGIGAAVTSALLSAGAVVLGLSRHMQAGREKLLEICDGETAQERLITADADATKGTAVEDAVAAFVQKQGQLDGLVYCAGQASLAPLRVWSRQQYQETFDVNLWGAMAALKTVSKKKYSSPGASHVFLSSVSARRGQAGLAAYGASKAALESLVRTAAVELAAKGQRVNSLCLGWVETPMTQEAQCLGAGGIVAPLGMGKPEDAAGMILYLLSDAARWMTGASLIVDGGYLA